jgi:signal transduction histidine kinase
VFGNLIDNAIKFTKPGGRINVTLRFLNSPADLTPIRTDVHGHGTNEQKHPASAISSQSNAGHMEDVNGNNHENNNQNMNKNDNRRRSSNVDDSAYHRIISPVSTVNSSAAAVDSTGEGLCVSSSLPRFLEFTVSDTGIGIRPEFIPKLWNSYSHTRFSSVTGTPSHAMGLSIVKRIMDGLNGRVRVDTKVGVGSTFTLLIPIQCLSADDVAVYQTLTVKATTEVAVRRRSFMNPTAAGAS